MKIKLNQLYSFNQLGRRSNQEDSRYPDVDVPKDAAPFFVVCDGVGGLDKGEVASRTVCEAFGKALSKTDWTKQFEVADFEEALTFAYDSLGKAIKKGSQDMATTMTFVAFHRGGVTMAHIGDSRIYQIRPGVGIIYRSDDHSLVNALVHSGNITPEQAIDHPQSNYITRSMGYVASGQPYSAATLVETVDVEKGDYFMACSDGVLHCIEDDQLIAIMEEKIPDSQKIKKIAELSYNSTDNNTAYMVCVADVEKETSDEKENVEKNPDSSSSDTLAFERKTNVAVEVSVKNKNGVGNKISEFFKKIF